jgi:hypothetical protein
VGGAPHALVYSRATPGGWPAAVGGAPHVIRATQATRKPRHSRYPGHPQGVALLYTARPTLSCIVGPPLAGGLRRWAARPTLSSIVGPPLAGGLRRWAARPTSFAYSRATRWPAARRGEGTAAYYCNTPACNAANGTAYLSLDAHGRGRVMLSEAKHLVAALAGMVTPDASLHSA